MKITGLRSMWFALALTMAFAVGHISGAHFNPAVSFGLWAGGRFPAGDLLPYIAAQVVGAVAAAGVLYVIASGATAPRNVTTPRLRATPPVRAVHSATSSRTSSPS